jgi:hypothetical protein
MRREMRPLQAPLAGSFSTIDWPGFGELAKPFVAWRPDLYDAYVACLFLFAQLIPDTFAVIAAGHAAGYVLKHFARKGRGPTKLVLLPRTWRGPLPTMAGGTHPIFAKIAKAFDPPLGGTLLYRLNVNRFVVGIMARGHVYADPLWLNGARMAEKLAVTRAPGARHGSARFVIGYLDPFRDKQEQIAAARSIASPITVVFGEEVPPKSCLEMDALTALPNVTTARLPQGKLSVYEEFPEETAEAISPFLNADPTSDRRRGAVTEAS